MSHVSTIEIQVKDLDCLEQAAKSLGLVFNRGAKNYKWFGRHVGDYPLPEGFSKEDLGVCDHSISVIGANSNTYEVGVVKRKDGKPGYQLLWDFFAGGYGLEAKIGKNAGKLRQAYATKVAKKQLLNEGYQVSEQLDERTGNIILRAR